MKKTVTSVLLVCCYALAYAQNPYRIVQNDTVVESGTVLPLCIDSIKAYNNFLFSAENPATGRWDIWKKNRTTNKYAPIFSDRYNRCYPAVSEDKQETIYVRYLTPREGAMHDATLDSAWICRNNVAGDAERVLIVVPQFNKNAVYDLDWTSDKTKVLYALGNDQYPTLTRDGDIFEYNITTKVTTNKTNNWELWSNHCRYKPGDSAFAYSHYGNFWYKRPTDIFIKSSDTSNVQQTSNLRWVGGYQYCTLTDFTLHELIYRRGEECDNKLFVRENGSEQLLLDAPGFGGVQIAENLYAAADCGNNLLLFSRQGLLGSSRVSAIDRFSNDERYNVGLDLNCRLNWLGKQNLHIRWSNGDTGFVTTIRAKRSKTYTCTVTANGVTYESSIKVTTGAGKPIIRRNCMTLSLPGYAAYQWLLNDAPLPGATDTSYTPNAPGTYNVQVKDNAGRMVTSTPSTIRTAESDSLTALTEQIKITPDPSTNQVQIAAPVSVDMLVINEFGKIILQKNDSHLLDMNTLPDGTYNIVLYDGGCLKLKAKTIKKEH